MGGVYKTDYFHPDSHLGSGVLNRSHDGLGQHLTVVAPLNPTDGNELHLLSYLGSGVDSRDH